MHAASPNYSPGARTVAPATSHEPPITRGRPQESSSSGAPVSFFDRLHCAGGRNTSRARIEALLLADDVTLIKDRIAALSVPGEHFEPALTALVSSIAALDTSATASLWDRLQHQLVLLTEDHLYQQKEADELPAFQQIVALFSRTLPPTAQGKVLGMLARLVDYQLNRYPLRLQAIDVLLQQSLHLPMQHQVYALGNLALSLAFSVSDHEDRPAEPLRLQLRQQIDRLPVEKRELIRQRNRKIIKHSVEFLVGLDLIDRAPPPQKKALLANAIEKLGCAPTMYAEERVCNLLERIDSLPIAETGALLVGLAGTIGMIENRRERGGVVIDLLKRAPHLAPADCRAIIDCIQPVVMQLSERSRKAVFIATCLAVRGLPEPQRVTFEASLTALAASLTEATRIDLLMRASTLIDTVASVRMGF